MKNESVPFDYNLDVDSSLKLPLYLQVKELIRRQILDGRFKTTQRLPAIKRLVRENSISVVTIARAYRLLEKEGLVIREKGNGYFVKGEGSSTKQITMHALGARKY